MPWVYHGKVFISKRKSVLIEKKFRTKYYDSQLQETALLKAQFTTRYISFGRNNEMKSKHLF